MREGSSLGVRTLLGVSVVLVLSAAAAGCETGAVLGESCRRSDECVNGVCVGGVCRAPLHLGTADAAPPQEDASIDEDADAAPEAGEDAAPEAGEDAALEAGEDATPEAGEDAAELDAPEEAPASDDGGDA